MQFDQEGRDDTHKPKAESIDTQATIELSNHFLENGLSRSAYNKIAPEIENGDMNVSILIECSDNDLNIMANQYNFTFLQKKAFIKAVNLLKLNNQSKNNSSNKSNDDSKDLGAPLVPIHLSPREQSILKKIDQLEDKLRQYGKECGKIKITNLNKINLAILKLENYKTLLIQCVDDEINKLVKKVCMLYVCCQLLVYCMSTNQVL